MLSADNGACTMQLNGSIPDTISLTQELDAPLGVGKRLLIYAGWPENADGELTGVVNYSNDLPGKRLQKNKLGPTVVWLVWGCKEVCIHSVVLKYVITITSDEGRLVYLLNKKEPFLDEIVENDHCLKPSFICERGNCAGAIDQPGSTISAEGDGYRSIAHNTYLVEADDRLDVQFKHREFIACDSKILAMTEWGYQLSAQLGSPAHLVLPDLIRDVNFELVYRDDADPAGKAIFDESLQQLSELHLEYDYK